MEILFCMYKKYVLRCISVNTIFSNSCGWSRDVSSGVFVSYPMLEPSLFVLLHFLKSSKKKLSSTMIVLMFFKNLVLVVRWFFRESIVLIFFQNLFCIYSIFFWICLSFWCFFWNSSIFLDMLVCSDVFPKLVPVHLTFFYVSDIFPKLVLIHSMLFLDVYDVSSEPVHVHSTLFLMSSIYLCLLDNSSINAFLDSFKFVSLSSNTCLDVFNIFISLDNTSFIHCFSRHL